MISDALGEKEAAFIDLVEGIHTVTEGAGLFAHLVTRYEQAVDEMPADEVPERLAGTVARYVAIATLVLDRLAELGPTTPAEQEAMIAIGGVARIWSADVMTLDRQLFPQSLH